MDRVQKEELVNSLRETFNAANSVVVSHFKGLTAAEAAELRRKMRAAGAQFRVTKNSLARRALDGTAFGGLEDLFEGPTGVACSKDPVAAAKASVEFAKDSDHLVILGGSLDGNRLSGDEVTALAALPSVDELRAHRLGGGAGHADAKGRIGRRVGVELAGLQLHRLERCF